MPCAFLQGLTTIHYRVRKWVCTWQTRVSNEKKTSINYHDEVNRNNVFFYYTALIN